MKIAVIGDSLSSRKNGAQLSCWPRLFQTMIEDGGVYGIEVRNFSVPGLTWNTAHNATSGFLIGGHSTPVLAVTAYMPDILIVCLGVNDRQNPAAITDAMSFKAALPACRIVWMRQNMYDGQGANDSVVTESEQQAMDAVYMALGGEGFSVNLRFLFDLGYSYDRLHTDHAGNQWLASAVYRYFEPTLPITPIGRNIGWLEIQTLEVQLQMWRCNFGTLAASHAVPVDPVIPVDPVPVDPVPPVSGGENIFWGTTQLPFIDTRKIPYAGSFDANGDRGYSVGFIADATRYPNGVIMEALDQTPESRLKDICISAEAHSFTPISKYAANQSPVSDFAQFFLRFGPAQVYYDVALIPGGKYYINFRGVLKPDGTRDTVYCEFDFRPQ